MATASSSSAANRKVTPAAAAKDKGKTAAEKTTKQTTSSASKPSTASSSSSASAPPAEETNSSARTLTKASMSMLDALLRDAVSGDQGALDFLHTLEMTICGTASTCDHTPPCNPQLNNPNLWSQFAHLTDKQREEIVEVVVNVRSGGAKNGKREYAEEDYVEEEEDHHHVHVCPVHGPVTDYDEEEDEDMYDDEDDLEEDDTFYSDEQDGDDGDLQDSFYSGSSSSFYTEDEDESHEFCTPEYCRHAQPPPLVDAPPPASAPAVAAPLVGSTRKRSATSRHAQRATPQGPIKSQQRDAYQQLISMFTHRNATRHLHQKSTSAASASSAGHHYALSAASSRAANAPSATKPSVPATQVTASSSAPKTAAPKPATQSVAKPKPPPTATQDWKASEMDDIQKSLLSLASHHSKKSRTVAPFPQINANGSLLSKPPCINCTPDCKCLLKEIKSSGNLAQAMLDGKIKPSIDFHRGPKRKYAPPEPMYRKRWLAECDAGFRRWKGRFLTMRKERQGKHFPWKRLPRGVQEIVLKHMEYDTLVQFSQSDHYNRSLCQEELSLFHVVYPVQFPQVLSRSMIPSLVDFCMKALSHSILPADMYVTALYQSAREYPDICAQVVQQLVFETSDDDSPRVHQFFLEIALLASSAFVGKEPPPPNVGDFIGRICTMGFLNGIELWELAYVMLLNAMRITKDGGNLPVKEMRLIMHFMRQCPPYSTNSIYVFRPELQDGCKLLKNLAQTSNASAKDQQTIRLFTAVMDGPECGCSHC